MDPLPLREEACSGQSPPQDPPASRPPRKAATSLRPPHPGPPPANRIQGTLRNPEFQHNGDDDDDDEGDDDDDGDEGDEEGVPVSGLWRSVTWMWKCRPG